MGDLAPVLVLISFAAGVACIFWIVFSNRRRIKIAEIQKEMHATLFEKFGTSQELVEYLKTEAGSKFLDSATFERPRPFGRVLGSVQAGIILFLLGLALEFVHATLPQAAFNNPTDHLQASESFLIISMLLMALGVGFLVSAAASYWLSKNWGLFEQGRARSR
ncbi:MAG TPA: hypothetical protein VJN21_06880 [Candidatus Acidoferrales bacterium]|nr:hypothetical protein [Candidatus Acidoferrales bacterium]